MLSISYWFVPIFSSSILIKSSNSFWLEETASWQTTISFAFSPAWRLKELVSWKHFYILSLRQLIESVKAVSVWLIEEYKFFYIFFISCSMLTSCSSFFLNRFRMFLKLDCSLSSAIVIMLTKCTSSVSVWVAMLWNIRRIIIISSRITLRTY